MNLQLHVKRSVIAVASPGIPRGGANIRKAFSFFFAFKFLGGGGIKGNGER